MEDTTKEPVAKRRRTQTITMSQTEHLAVYLNQSRLSETDHAKLLKIGICPYIVVTLKEIHLYTTRYQVLNRGQDTHISLRNYISILIPEIPDVAQQIKRLCILRKRAQKAHKTSLTGCRLSNL
jgi:hypothetical protein